MMRGRIICAPAPSIPRRAQRTLAVVCNVTAFCGQAGGPQCCSVGPRSALATQPPGSFVPAQRLAFPSPGAGRRNPPPPLFRGSPRFANIPPISRSGRQWFLRLRLPSYYPPPCRSPNTQGAPGISGPSHSQHPKLHGYEHESGPTGRRAEPCRGTPSCDECGSQARRRANYGQPAGGDPVGAQGPAAEAGARDT